MIKSKRYYYKFLHYCLVNNALNEETFNVMTTLTDEEISMWFSSSRSRIFKIIERLSLVTQYQQARLNDNRFAWLKYRKRLLQRCYLWSDAASFQSIPEDCNEKELGLILLAVINRRQALIWSLRLGVKLPERQIIMDHPEYLSFIVLE